MDAAKAIAGVIDMVPQWYIASTGPQSYGIEVDGVRTTFRAHRRPTPNLAKFLQAAQDDLPDLIAKVEPFPDSVALDLIQEYFAEAWLSELAPAIAWKKLFNYSRDAFHRTYENAEVAFNFLIRGGQGTRDITEIGLQKVVDPLASSNWTYMELDPELRFLGYREVPWDAVTEVSDYKFHPDFLHPYASVLADGEWSVHKTRRGDLVIMDDFGLVAARRKGRWKVYDVQTMKNSITSAIGDYRVGCNLFDVLFDLSFRRHGALLVYDPKGMIPPQIANPESILNDARRDAAREMLASAVAPIRMGAVERSHRHKNVFLEVAGLDGAVVFDSDRVIAIGAMIKPHPDVPGQFGARSTAAFSAYLHGARPVKISSDGEITIHFTTHGPGRKRDHARLEFL